MLGRPFRILLRAAILASSIFACWSSSRAAEILAQSSGPQADASDSDSDRPTASSPPSRDGNHRPDTADTMHRASQADARPDERGQPKRSINFGLIGQIIELGASIQAHTAAAGAVPLRALVPLPQIAGHRPESGVPPDGENRLMQDEIVVEVANATTPQAITALSQRNLLVQLDSFASQLTGTTLVLFRVQDQRPVSAVIRALDVEGAVISAQPNYLFALQQLSPPAANGSAPPQYALAKLRLPEAHGLANGNNVLVGMIDSGVDSSHPELTGAIAATFDAIGGGGKPNDHGTAIAGLIAAHAKLTGAAPAARILAVRAFDIAGPTARGTTFNILKGLDWTATHGARVINMSFAGPPDPAIHRSLEAAYRNTIVLVAAAGNAGPTSPPLYPAADPNVVAVTATDANDGIFAAANQGPYIAIAAPGVDLLVAAPDGSYEISSGTSFSAAEVTGIVALMLQRRPNLGPDDVRDILLTTGKVLDMHAAQDSAPRLADAYQAILIKTPASAR